MCPTFKRILRHKLAYRYKINIFTFKLEDTTEVKKTTVDVHWTNRPLSELGVCGRENKKGDKTPTYRKSANFVSRATGNPGGSHPGKVPITSAQLYGCSRPLDDPWAMYSTVSTRERLHVISRSTSYEHYSYVSVNV
jgi:hypothetical protein